MAKIISNSGSSPTILTKRYDKFAGVDYSSDPATIADNRSPIAVNIISDAGGYPEKRVGWRALKEFEGRINGIYSLNGKMVVHAGSAFYEVENEDAEPRLLTEEIGAINDDKSFGIVFVGKLWILTGNEFLVFDGETMSNVRDVATVPQVLAMADDTFKNGISYQPFNLLTPKRKVGITAEGSLKTFTFSQQIVLGSMRIFNAITGEEITAYSIEKITTNYDGVQKNYYRITLTTAINVSGAGEAVLVEYIPLETPNAESNQKLIERCTFAAIYENRLFVSGNPEHPNTDFYCELNDPTYFADVNYTNIGTDNEVANIEAVKEREENFIGTGGTRIMGYSYVGNYLAIHKDGAENGASLYLRSSSMTDDGMIFPVEEGIVGESVVSARATKSFIDDPLFITKSGVYAVASADITKEKCLQSRSTRVNTKLTLEKDLENAEMCVYDGYLYLFVNGNVYVADSRQKNYPRNTSNAYEYEWYFWDSIPARVVLAFNDTVYFGTEDGRLCRFNNDIIDERGGYAMQAYNDDGAPIVALWATKFDDLGDFGVLKQLKRRGSGIYIKTFGATNIKVIIRTDKDFGKQINYAKRGLFNFLSLDFANLNFNTQPFSFVPFGQKVKDWRMAQVICKNDELNQALGVYAIELRYIKGYFAK